LYDFGGGTFDISVLEVGAGVVEVKSTNVIPIWAGDDIDQRIVDWLIDEFKKKNNIDLSKDKMALQRLKDAAEKSQDRALADDGDGNQPAVYQQRARTGRFTWRKSSRARGLNK